jgi:hypothetical protein
MLWKLNMATDFTDIESNFYQICVEFKTFVVQSRKIKEAGKSFKGPFSCLERMTLRNYEE